jgi:transcription elongation GreA/GreB family factor
VTFDEDGAEQQRVLIAPYGGGTMLAGGVQVVTPAAPFGRTLLGKRAGDELEIQLPGRVRSLEIIAVA